MEFSILFCYTYINVDNKVLHRFNTFLTVLWNSANHLYLGEMCTLPGTGHSHPVCCEHLIFSVVMFLVIYDLVSAVSVIHTCFCKELRKAPNNKLCVMLDTSHQHVKQHPPVQFISQRMFYSLNYSDSFIHSLFIA